MRISSLELLGCFKSCLLACFWVASCIRSFFLHSCLPSSITLYLRNSRVSWGRHYCIRTIIREDKAASQREIITPWEPAFPPNSKGFFRPPCRTRIESPHDEHDQPHCPACPLLNSCPIQLKIHASTPQTDSGH